MNLRKRERDKGEELYNEKELDIFNWLINS